jgi:hypothetical protein
MRKLLATLLVVFSVFIFAVGAYADAFKPADEPVTPFERVEYYVKDATDSVLEGYGMVEGNMYGIAVLPTNDVLMVKSDWLSLLIVAKLANGTYVAAIQSLFGSMEFFLSQEAAEMLADDIFASAENDGVFFRRGFVLNWLPNLGYYGGY